MFYRNRMSLPQKVARAIAVGLVEFIKTIASIGRVLLLSRFNLGLSKHRQQNNKAGVVFGNGPSLKKTLREDADKLSSKQKICVNSFVLSDDFERFKPELYIFSDPYYYAKDNSLAMERELQKVIRTLKKKTRWKMTVFLPAMARTWSPFLNLSRTNKNITLGYFNITTVSCFRRLRYYFYRKNLAMPPAQNVLVAALYLLLQLGFKRIYLVGADHDWFEKVAVGQDNRVYRKDPHFYDNAPRPLIPLYQDIEQTRTFTMAEMHLSAALAYQAYAELDDYAKSLGARIYNASGKSYIDAFERRRLT